ncbi:MAG TPA: hypothetical protein VMV20_07230 [Chitinophagaceae bacterium]|nr:hypothetical protein [Chitinophagaceae bacterium]
MFFSSDRQILNTILENDRRPLFEKEAIQELGPEHRRTVGFLHEATNAFDRRFKEVMSEPFWEQEPGCRFTRMREGYQLFRRAEQFMHEKYGLTPLEKYEISPRSKIGLDLFKLLQIVAGNPVLGQATWMEVDLSRIGEDQETMFLELFWAKYRSRGKMTARFWEQYMKKTAVVTLDFNGDPTRMLLAELIREEEGIKFFFIYMRKIMVKQIKKISDRIHLELSVCNN